MSEKKTLQGSKGIVLDLGGQDKKKKFVSTEKAPLSPETKDRTWKLNFMSQMKRKNSCAEKPSLRGDSSPSISVNYKAIGELRSMDDSASTNAVTTTKQKGRGLRKTLSLSGNEMRKIVEKSKNEN